MSEPMLGDFGRTAYQAFHREDKNFPAWETLTLDERNAWKIVANAVIAHVLSQDEKVVLDMKSSVDAFLAT